MILRLAILLTKTVVGTLMIWSVLLNPNLIWVFTIAIVAWCTIEILDTTRWAYYAFVGRTVLPASVMPFALAGLRNIELHPAVTWIFWEGLILPLIFGFAIAWLFPRLFSRSARIRLDGETRAHRARMAALAEEWGDSIADKYVPRRIFLE